MFSQSKGPLRIYIIILVSIPAAFAALEGVKVTGDDIDAIYIKQNSEDTCGNVLHIQNNNTFDVTAVITSDNSTLQVYVTANNLTTIFLNSSFLNDSTIIGVCVRSENETYSRNITVVHYDSLAGLNVQYPSQVNVSETAIITANVSSGTGVTFQLLAYTSSNISNESIVATCDQISDKMAHFSIIPTSSGTYTLKLSVISQCGEILTSVFSIMASSMEQNDQVFSLCPPSNETNIMDGEKQQDPVCVKTWNDEENIITEININLMSESRIGFIRFKNALNESDYPLANGNETTLRIVLSSWRGVVFQDNDLIFNESVHILLDDNNAGDTSIFVINDYQQEAALEYSNKTGRQFITISPRRNNSIILGNYLYPNESTNLTIRVCTDEYIWKQILVLFFHRSLFGLNVNYKETAIVHFYNILSASVLSGIQVKFEFLLLSPEDPSALLTENLTKNATGMNIMFKPSMESNYTILVNVTSLCHESLTQTFTIASNYLELCPRKDTNVILQPEDDALSSVCVKAQYDNLNSLTILSLDITSDINVGFLNEQSNSEDIFNDLISSKTIENITESKVILLINLTCWQNSSFQNYVFLDKSVHLLHAVNNTKENVLLIQNNYLIEANLEFSNVTSHQILTIPPQKYYAINLGYILNFNASTKLIFKVNTTKEILTKNLSLIFQESLTGLTVDYPNKALVHHEYNITASIISGTNIQFKFILLSPDDPFALVAENTTANDTAAQILFMPNAESNYTFVLKANSSCQESLSQTFLISSNYQEICSKKESNIQSSNFTNEPVCLKDWYDGLSLVNILNMDLTSGFNGGFIANDSQQEIKSFINLNNLTIHSGQVMFLIVLTCLQDYTQQVNVTMFCDNVHILHKVTQTFNTYIFVQNNHNEDVFLDFTNKTDYQSLLISPGELNFLDLGDTITYYADLNLGLKINTSREILTKNISFTYQESLFDLQVEYLDNVLIGNKSIIKAFVFSGSNLSFDFMLLSPIDDQAILPLEINSTSDKAMEVTFNPFSETNYTIAVSVLSSCQEKITKIIIIEAEFPEMCPKNDYGTFIDGDDALNNSNKHPVCMNEERNLITEMTIDLVSDSNTGLVYTRNESSNLIKNLTLQANCTIPGVDPSVISIVLACHNVNTTGTEFNNTVFILHNIENTCSRVFLFQNTYSTEVMLTISDGGVNRTLEIKRKSFNSTILPQPVLFKFTSFSFILKTKKEFHSTNVKLKYERLEKLNVSYKANLLVHEVTNITASVSSGSQIVFFFKIISPVSNDTIAHLNQTQTTYNNLESWALFQALEDYVFNIYVQAESSCGQVLTSNISIYPVYPDLCPTNNSLVKNQVKSSNFMPVCLLDLSREIDTVTQIRLDVTSDEITSYTVMRNYTSQALSNLTSSQFCQNKTGNVLLYYIDLTCPQSSFDGIASSGKNGGETIYILQKLDNLCGHGFYIANHYYNDTQLKIVNGSFLEPQNFLSNSYITSPIKDELQLVFNLIYHRKIYKKTIFLVFHEILSGLVLNYNKTVLVGVPCIIMAVTDGGAEMNFNFQIFSPDKNQSLSNGSYVMTKIENRKAELNFTPSFVGSYTVSVDVTSFCKENLTQTIQLDADLCLNSISSLDLTLTTPTDSLSCLVNWGDNQENITEFNIDLNQGGIIGYSHQINSSYYTMMNYTHSNLCPNARNAIVFSISLSCFSGLDSGEVSLINASIYIKRGIHHPCEEVAVVYNNYTLDVNVTYQVKSSSQNTQIPAKSYSMITLPLSFAADNIFLSFTMPFSNTLVQKNLTLIHFDELYNLNISFERNVLIASTWNVTATVDSGEGVIFSLNITPPDGSVMLTNADNYTIENITTKKARLSFIPMDEGLYNIKVTAISMCGEMLYSEFTIFAFYAIQNSRLDTDYYITKYRKDPKTFYPKDIVAIAMKVTDSFWRHERPTLPICTIDWGDNQHVNTEQDVDLTPNKNTGYIYVRNHTYLSLGEYQVNVHCYNAISRVEDKINFTVVSPVKHADLTLLSDLVVYNSNNSTGLASVKLIQDYLHEDFPELITSLDFGVHGSQRNETFINGRFFYNFSYSKKGNYSISVIIEAYGVKKTNKFNIRVGYLVKFEHETLRWLIRVRENTTFYLFRFWPDTYLNVTFDLEKLQQGTFKPGQNKISVQDIYYSEAVREAKASIEVNGIVEFETYKFESFFPCISTLDFFDVTYRNISTPLQGWLNFLPFISGRAEKTIECNYSHILNMEWTVWKMDVNDSWTVQNIIQPRAVVMNFNFITTIGLFKIRLNIFVQRKNETEEDIMYMNVTYPPLSIKIKYGALKQVKLGNNYTLDAESETKILTRVQNVSYVWQCFMLTSKDDIPKYTQSNNIDIISQKLQSCMNSSFPINSGKMIISTVNFSLNDLVLFHVTVTVGSRSGTASQVIQICENVPVDLDIKCIWNCMEKLATDERTVLEAVILDYFQDIKSAEYHWYIEKYHGENLEDVDFLNTTTNSTLLDIAGGWWEEGVTYLVSVNVTMENYLESRAIRNVIANFKPYGGNCSVTPSEGNATETPFLFQFSGWMDEGVRHTQNVTVDSNFGLQYEIHQETSAGSYIVYAGNEVSASVYLTECKKDEVENCKVMIYIRDMYRAKAQCDVFVKVLRNHETVNTDISIFTVLDKRLNSSLMMGDPLKIAQRAASFSTFVVTMTSPGSVLETTTTASPVQSKNQLITNVTNSYVETVSAVVQDNSSFSGQIQIMANSMAIVTAATELLSTKSMETASGALKKLTNSLINIEIELSSLSPSLESIKDITNNIIKVQTLETAKLYSFLKNNYAGYTDDEIQELIQREQEALKKSQQTKLLQFDNIVQNVTAAWNDYFLLAKNLVNSHGKYESEKDTYKIALQKSTLDDVMNETSYNPPLGFTFNNIDDNSLYSKIHIKAVKTSNIFTQGFNSKYINTDIVIGSVQQEDGKKLNLTKPMIAHEQTNCTQENIPLTNPKLIEEDASQMFYHKFEYTNIFLQFCIKIRPVNPLISYKLYLRMDLEPSDLAFDYSQLLTPENFAPCKGFCFEPGLFNKKGIVYLGLQPYLDTNLTLNQVSGRQKRQAQDTSLESPYYFGITSAACFSWEESIQDWTNDKCKLTNLTGTITCVCENTKEIISGMSFNFFPNTIHFATVFSKFDIKGQGLVIGVLTILYFSFALIAFWAHYMDKRSMFQWGVFPLVDNYAYDTYFYLISVHTGLRKSSGTTSNVSFTLSGQFGETGIRKLSDGIKKGFPTGSVYNFVMACPESLGELQCLRVWHDSMGHGGQSSWYLDRIDVVDLQNGTNYYFICDEWLAPEYGIDKMVEASSIEDLEKLKNVFFTNTKEHITDDHMWISLFIRPQRSNFSRVERAMCCLAFLLLSMITSAMFYKGAEGLDRKQAPADFEIGIIRLSYQQMYQSFASAVISAIPMIFVMMIFRKARTYGGYCCSNKVQDSNKNTDENKKKKSFLPWMVKLEAQLKALEKVLLFKPASDSLHGNWPYPLRYVAWLVLLASIITSSFFVLLYSMEWGGDITETWMSTFFLTFLQSLIIVDPIKVVLISVIVSLLLRKAKINSLEHLDLHYIAEINRAYGIKEKYTQLDMSYAPPLRKSELKAATQKRRIHLLISTMWKEFVIHFFYILIVASLCHATRTSKDFHMYNVVFQQVVNDPDTGFLQIKNSKDYFDWLAGNFSTWLFPTNDLSLNTSLPDNIFYTNEKDLYRLGTPRIRQLRTKKENCLTNKIKLKDCVPTYGFTNEETGDFCPYWSISCNSYQKNDLFNAWQYQKSQDVWGLPIAGEYGLYNGGGYIALMRFKDTVNQTIEALRSNMWIDRQTRAVFIEFTLYCPNINHFMFVVLLAEFMETGAIVPFFSIYPFTVHTPSGFMGTYLQLCQLVGTIFTFISCLYVVFMLSKKKLSALKDFWFILDLAAVITAISAAAMMFLRLKFTNSVLSKIKENRAQFVNMYHVVVWDSAYTLCLAILIAIGCFRLLKLASYSETTMKVYMVLCKAVAILPNFCVYIFLILMSFIFFGWLAFGTTSIYFKNFMSAAETMFTGILGRSSFKDTNSPISDKWLNIIFFCLFVGLVVIFLINFFLAVLIDLLKKYELSLKKGENTKIFIVVWDMFMRMMGSKRNPLDRLKTEQDEDEFSDSDEEIVKDQAFNFDKSLNLIEKRLLKLSQTEDDLIQYMFSTKKEYPKLYQTSKLKRLSRKLKKIF